MKVIIAPNAFKNSLTAVEVADAITEGLTKSDLNVECMSYPLADGGDGTLEVLHSIFGGEYYEETVEGPLGQNVKAKWVKSGDMAFIEMAEASGLRLLKPDQYDPMKANTMGTGQLILSALDKHVKKIIIGIGGSATVDGGAGILKALGVKFYKKGGVELQSGNYVLETEKIDISGIDNRIYDVGVEVLCDVNNPLLGSHGAAHIFGPQKGASPDQVETLEQSLSRYADVVKASTGTNYADKKSTGAAGGISFMFKSFFDATFVSGAEFVINESGIRDHIEQAAFVVTGEGHLDSQSVEGKAPFVLSTFADKYNKPCIGLAGKWENDPALKAAFTALFTVVKGPGSIDEALEHAKKNIIDTSTQIGNLWHAATSLSIR